jgi:hypothetical protein
VTAAHPLHIALPERLRALVATPHRGLAFGIPALDVLLPLGLPRGQLTALDAPLGSGGTALLLTLAETTLHADEGVAYVDAARSLAPQAAAHLAAHGGFWVIRPRGTESAWWCADVLLRTGAFGLVVVDQGPAPPRAVAVRLQRLARDKDAVVVLRAADRSSGASVPLCPRALPHAALTLTVRPDPTGFLAAAPGSGAAWPGPRTVRVHIEKGGAPRAAVVTVGLALPHRLRPHWAVRDRRARSSGGRRSLGGRTQRPRCASPDWPSSGDR